ncbi:hypothetical protein [Alteromonas sp. AMM-1]|uniref:hypothetical protein n=1 Tax=Alteromonas sp. AMM-1 TaxID=3394233 RepID=UPI0039A5A32B
MNHLIATLPYILFSLVIIGVLAYSDPRRRQLHQKVSGKTTRAGLPLAVRKALAWSLALPFIPMALTGNVAGMLMYAGALTVIGWLVTEIPASVI